MKMKKYKKYTILSLAISFAIIVAYYLSVYYLYSRPYSSELVRVHSFVKFKDQIISEVEKTKIVFISGSSTLCGIRTKNIQKEFGIPAINYAVTARLPVDYMIYKAKKTLKKGDVIIMPLEYEHFVYNGESTQFKTAYIMTWDRDYLNSLSAKGQFDIIKNIGIWDIDKAFSESRQFQGKDFTAIEKHVKSIINENGDIIYGETTKENWNFELEIQERDYKETFGLKTLKEFNAWCNENGIYFYVTFANTMFHDKYKTDKYSKYFEWLLGYFEKNNVTVIGTPYDFFFEKKLFYDTQYHLTNEGIEMRTKQFIKMMRDFGIDKKIKAE